MLPIRMVRTYYHDDKRCSIMNLYEDVTLPIAFTHLAWDAAFRVNYAYIWRWWS